MYVHTVCVLDGGVVITNMLQRFKKIGPGNSPVPSHWNGNQNEDSHWEKCIQQIYSVVEKWEGCSDVSVVCVCVCVCVRVCVCGVCVRVWGVCVWCVCACVHAGEERG